MNALDIAIIVAVLAAGIGGWRLGFVARVFAWGGVALGLVIGIHYVPRVVTAFGGTSADDRVTVAVLFLVLVATLGQALGLGLGVVVHRYSGDGTPLPRWDRIAGAAVGTLGVLAARLDDDPVARDGEGLARPHGARAPRSSAFLDDLTPTPTRPVRGVGPRDLRRAVPLRARSARLAARPRAPARGRDPGRGRPHGAHVDREGQRTRVPPDPRRAAAGSRRAASS